MEIVSIFVSILSLVISAVLAIHTFNKERESYSIDVLDYRSFGFNVTQFFLRINNHSSEPLTITYIKYDGICCRFEQTNVETTANGTVVRATAEFPLRIPEYGACNVYVVFPDTGVPHKQLRPGMSVTFQVQTTRKLSLKTLTLSHTTRYLHKDTFC